MKIENLEINNKRVQIWEKSIEQREQLARWTIIDEKRFPFNNQCMRSLLLDIKLIYVRQMQSSNPVANGFDRTLPGLVDSSQTDQLLQVDVRQNFDKYLSGQNRNWLGWKLAGVGERTN